MIQKEKNKSLKKEDKPFLCTVYTRKGQILRKKQDNFKRANVWKEIPQDNFFKGQIFGKIKVKFFKQGIQLFKENIKSKRLII